MINYTCCIDVAYNIFTMFVKCILLQYHEKIFVFIICIMLHPVVIRPTTGSDYQSFRCT